VTNEVYLGQYTSGDDIAIDVSIVDEAGAALNINGLQGATFKVTNGVTVVRKELGDGITIADGPAGLLTVDIDEFDTEGFDGLFSYELEIVDFDGKYRTPVFGQILFRRGLIANNTGV
jgi:hypothetical protein